MDIQDLKISEKAATFSLRDPRTGAVLEHDGAEMTATVYGQDSLIYRKAFRDQQNQNRHLSGKELTLEEVDDLAIDLLAACVEEISVFRSGEWLKYDLAGEIKGLLKDYKWIRDQIDRFIHTRANFIEG